MSLLLDRMRGQASACPDALAFRNSAGEELTYGQLWSMSDSIAALLMDAGADRAPVVVRGHKQALMMAAILGCMKAGSAYVPLDTTIPDLRAGNVVRQLDDPVILEAASGLCDGIGSTRIVRCDELASVAAAGHAAPEGCRAVEGEDPLYILFTSGSTGDPKGVVQPTRTIDNFLRYYERFVPEGERLVFFNRTHFSFDMSLFDYPVAFANGHSIFALSDEADESLKKTFEALAGSDAALWVSTPSFLNMCLADPSFSQELMPRMRCFLICGETFYNATAAKALERFPQAAVYNTYGPTETQAVTDIRITPQMAAFPEPLPIGYAGPYSEVQIVDPQTREALPANQRGEIRVVGQTVALGYYERPDLTERAFGRAPDAAGQLQPAYCTGDAGSMDADGLIRFYGRFDNQVKINGFRIELQEIEEALNVMDEVLESCAVPIERNGVPSAIAAHVAPMAGTVGDRQLTRTIKERLKEVLPPYMVPRTVVYHEALPKNVNGKIDRKALSV